MDEAESYLFGLFEKVRCLRETHILEECVQGEPLSRRIETEHYLTEREARRCLLALADGLAVLHAHRILHRDIKPENLIDERDGTIRLIDFDAARVMGAEGEEKAAAFVSSKAWPRLPPSPCWRLPPIFSTSRRQSRKSSKSSKRRRSKKFSIPQKSLSPTSAAKMGKRRSRNSRRRRAGRPTSRSRAVRAAGRRTRKKQRTPPRARRQHRLRHPARRPRHRRPRRQYQWPHHAPRTPRHRP